MKIRDLIVFFLLAYAISWLIWSPMWLPYFGVNIKPVLPYQHGFGGLGPMLSAFITTAIFYKKAGLQALWRRLFQWRPLRWTLVALLLPFAFSLFGGFIARITEGSFPIFTYRPGYTAMDMAGVIGWFFSIVAGAVVFTWLFNGSRGSLLACAVFHGLIDVVFLADYGNDNMMQYIGMLVTLWGIAVLLIWGWKNLASGERVESF
jgi:hypothetical protein